MECVRANMPFRHPFGGACLFHEASFQQKDCRQKKIPKAALCKGFQSLGELLCLLTLDEKKRVERSTNSFYLLFVVPQL